MRDKLLMIFGFCIAVFVYVTLFFVPKQSVGMLCEQRVSKFLDQTERAVGGWEKCDAELKACMKK